MHTRRHFLTGSAAAAAAFSLGLKTIHAEPDPLPRLSIIGFTKLFQHIGFEKTAEVVAEIGWKGIECPVRKKGQVEPERVEDDLPKLNDALKAKNLTLSIATTDLVDGTTPFAEKVLRTAKKLGVSRYRLGFMKYDLSKPIPPQLANFKAGLRDLAAMSKEIGIRGGIQNHSGAAYVGCAIWDIYELVHDLDPQTIGACYDIGHSTLEGGLAWPLNARLIEPFMTAVYIKDFQWLRGKKGFEPKWGPLGEGMVKKEFIDWLKKSSYDGPISQHVEFIEGASPENIAIMKKDCETLKSWLA